VIEGAPAPGGAAAAPGRRPARRDGPPLALLAAISAALLLAAYLVTGLLAGGFSLSPAATAASVLGELRHSDAIRTGAVLGFGSAVPLGIYAATVSARLRNLGIRAPGATIALFGGVFAAGLLSVGSLASWALSEPLASPQPALLQVVQNIGLAAAGPGRLAGLGLLLAGVAVPAAFTGLLPRPLVAAGLGLALLDELSTLTLFSDLPARLGVALAVLGLASLAWLTAAGALLPLTRQSPGARRPGRTPKE